MEGGQRCATLHEVYFNHFQILAAHDQEAHAQAYLHRAYHEVRQRAEEIEEPQSRESFLKNVLINRQIVQAWEAAQQRSAPSGFPHPF